MKKREVPEEEIVAGEVEVEGDLVETGNGDHPAILDAGDSNPEPEEATTAKGPSTDVPIAVEPVPEPESDAVNSEEVKSFHLGGRSENPWSLASSIGSVLFLVAMVFVTGGFVFKWFLSDMMPVATDLFDLLSIGKFMGVPYFVCATVAGVCWFIARKRNELKAGVTRSMVLFAMALLGFPTLLFVFGLIRLLQAYAVTGM